MKTILRKARNDVWTSELRCATGRSAIRYLLDQLDVPGVLMPCYVPEGVIDPVRDAGLHLDFYKLNADLTPDFDAMNTQMHGFGKSRDGWLVVVIDYFGFECVTGKLERMLHAFDFVLFEDCAHARWAKAPYADVALWSENKFLPVVDGAVMRSRCVNVHVGKKDMQPPLPQTAISAYNHHLRLNAEGHFEEGADWYEKYYARIRHDFALRRQSHESMVIAASIESDSLERKRNAYRLHHSIPEEFKMVRLDKMTWHEWPALFAYPIMCRDVWREDVCTRLIKTGIMASMLVDKWDHIPNTVAVADGQFEHERRFCDQHLLLPIDGSVTAEDIEAMAECLREFVKTEKVA